ncbi:MAG: glycosyltransferase family 9 protein [Syntrophotaleaceae bacterium]
MTSLDVLIPTYNRPEALAVTLSGLAGQSWKDFRIVISDQSPDLELEQIRITASIIRLLRAQGHTVDVHKHLPRRGMAEQRQFLLDLTHAPYALFLDDDLMLESWQIAMMIDSIRSYGCGFVGSAPIGLSFLNDLRPQEQQIDFWDGPVTPETVLPDTPDWNRYRLHNAANLFHLQKQLGAEPATPRAYKVAWVGGCVLYDTACLQAVGGFNFWRDMPETHCGEDVLAQLRVMARYGGCGLMPSGVYHQELPTTVPDRQIDAPRFLDPFPKPQDPAPLRIPGVKKIAVLRCNGLGDFLFAVPALHALKRAYPGAELVLLARRWLVDFLQNRPGPVDRVLEVPPCRGVGEAENYQEDAQELEAFFHRMEEERFDLALQMHGGGLYSNPFVRRLGARLTSGCRSPEAAPLDRWAHYTLYQPEVLRYLEVAALVGATGTALQPTISVTEADLQEARSALPETSEPLVIFHPGAGDPRRRWPPEKFIVTGRALEDFGARVAVVGMGAEEERLADEIVKGLDKRTVDLSGRLSLGGLAGLLSRADLLLANDSGPLHLAAAVGAPTIGIFWCGNLITAGPPTRTWHRPVISWRMHCPICGQDCSRYNCGHKASFVADVDARDVTASALALLQLRLDLLRLPQD